MILVHKLKIIAFIHTLPALNNVFNNIIKNRSPRFSQAADCDKMTHFACFVKELIR